MTKIKVCIRRDLLKDKSQLSEKVRGWIEAHEIKFDRKGYADAPKVPNGGLYADGASYYVPYDPDVRVYQTLDQRHFYNGKDGRKAYPETHRLVVYPLKTVHIEAERITINKHFVVRGADIAQLVHEVVFDGNITNLPRSLRNLADTHIKNLRDTMRRKNEARLAKESKNKAA